MRKFDNFSPGMYNAGKGVGSMDKLEFEKIVCERYGVEGDHPFEGDFDTTVFRHPSSRKWFGIVMSVPKCRLEGDSREIVNIINVKCPYEVASSFYSERGFYPAYHMNKKHWLSILLDGSVDLDTVLWFMDISHDLTRGKKKK